MRNNRQSIAQARLCLTAQFCDLVIGKFGQNRITTIGLECTAFGDLNRVVQRLRQISKQGRHFSLRFEIVLRGQTATSLLLIHIGTIRNTDQGIMRLVHLRGWEIDIIGGNQRQTHRIRHLDKRAFGHTFGFGQSTINRVTLQFDIQTITKDTRQTIHQSLRRGNLTCLQQLTNWAIRPTGQADNIRAVLGQLIHSDLRQLIAVFDIQARIQLHQVFVTCLSLGQQNHRRRGTGFFTRTAFHVGHIDLTADNRLNAPARHRNGILQSGKHVIRVGQRHRRHLCIYTKARQLFQPQCAFQ